MRAKERGFTYLEVLAASALLGITLVASTGLLLRWHVTSERLEERAAAVNALAVEMDEILVRDGAALPPGRRAWFSDADRVSGLPEAEGLLIVEAFGRAGLKRVSVRITWVGGEAVRECLLGAAP